MTCALADCNRPHYGLGYCRLHYRRFKSTGDPRKVLMSGVDFRRRPTCSVEGCEKPHASRGLCTMHRARLDRHGDPLTAPIKDMTLRDATRGLPVLERFAARIRFPSGLFGCWIWQGNTNGPPPKDYGLMNALVEITGERLTHRAMFVLVRASIPEELQLDHLCRNAPCCNPWHLEPVTGLENVRRGIVSRAVEGKIRAVGVRQSHCRRGHPLSGDNLRIESYGSQRCKACAREANRRYKAKFGS